MTFMQNVALRTAVLTSSGDPTLTLDLDFLLASGSAIGNATRKGPALTFTSTGTRWYFNSSGLLVSAGANVPRFDHNFAGTRLGLLIEEARTNSALWSRDMTNAAWVKSNMASAQDATGLDGLANTATTLTASAGNATALQTVTIASAAYTYSVYVKRVTGTGNIDITDNNGTNWTTLTGLSSVDFTRYEITRTQANPVFGVRIVTSGDAVEVDVTQLEAGEVMTSPILTTTASVARPFDRCQTTSVGWYANAQGTFITKVRHSPSIGAGEDRYHLRISDGTLNNRLQMDSFIATTVVSAQSVAGNTLGITGGATVTGATQTFALAYDTNDCAGSLDGAASVLDALYDPWTVPAIRFDVGDDGSGTARWLNGYVQSIKYYNTRKPNSFLEAA